VGLLPERHPGDADVTLASAWKQVSYNFIFFVAGLQSIPRAVTEAAAWTAERLAPLPHHHLPSAGADDVLLLVVNLVYAAFDTFGTIYALTQGGPGQVRRRW